MLLGYFGIQNLKHTLYYNSSINLIVFHHNKKWQIFPKDRQKTRPPWMPCLESIFHYIEFVRGVYGFDAIIL